MKFVIIPYRIRRTGLPPLGHSPLLASRRSAARSGGAEKSGAGYAFSVTSYAFPIQRAIRIRPDLRVEMPSPLGGQVH